LNNCLGFSVYGLGLGRSIGWGQTTNGPFLTYVGSLESQDGPILTYVDCRTCVWKHTGSGSPLFFPVFSFCRVGVSIGFFNLWTFPIGWGLPNL
jgi:hypothetical protein